MRKFTRESEVEKYLVDRVHSMGGEIRKLQWNDRNGAPDRVVMQPGGRLIFIEVKAPGLAAKFPSNAHERAQAREHEKLRRVGQIVHVVDSPEAIDEVLYGS